MASREAKCPNLRIEALAPSPRPKHLEQETRPLTLAQPTYEIRVLAGCPTNQRAEELMPHGLYSPTII